MDGMLDNCFRSLARMKTAVVRGADGRRTCDGLMTAVPPRCCHGCFSPCRRRTGRTSKLVVCTGHIVITWFCYISGQMCVVILSASFFSKKLVFLVREALIRTAVLCLSFSMLQTNCAVLMFELCRWSTCAFLTRFLVFFCIWCTQLFLAKFQSGLKFFCTVHDCLNLYKVFCSNS